MLKGPREDRILMTGLHTVRDVYCTQCHLPLGWTYVRTLAAGSSVASPSPLCCVQDEAFEQSQKYKEGKFVIEKVRMARAASWKG